MNCCQVDGVLACLSYGFPLLDHELVLLEHLPEMRRGIHLVKRGHHLPRRACVRYPRRRGVTGGHGFTFNFYDSCQDHLLSRVISLPVLVVIFFRIGDTRSNFNIHRETDIEVVFVL